MMVLLILVNLIIFVFSKNYRAAVVSFENLRTIEKYVEYIQESSKKGKVDILIFPELGINQTSFGYLDIEIVNIGSNPCEEGRLKTNPLQYEISCQASENHIYVVFGMAEKGEICEKGTPHCIYGYYVYNTALVISSNGTVVSKYRKHNPWIPEFFKPGPNIPTYFDTDFGVRFGYFICYDLLFTHPSTDLITTNKINNILYPTWWIDGLGLNISFSNQFMSAIQVQQAYALFYKINFLAPNGLIHSNGNGIFSKGKVIDQTYSGDSIMFADIPIFDPITPPKLKRMKSIPSFQNELETNKMELFSGNKSTVELQLSVGKCIFEYEIEKGEGEYFMFTAFRENVKNQVFLDVCGIVNCGKNNEIKLSDCKNDFPSTKFKNLKITMNIKDDIRMILPLISTTENHLLEDNPEKQFDLIINDPENQYIVQNTDSLTQPIQYLFQTAVLFEKKNN